jgi:hypothetical protein
MFRSAVYTGAAFIGLTDTLIARRSAPVTQQERAELQKVYDEVLQRRLEDRQQTAPAGDA